MVDPNRVDGRTAPAAGAPGGALFATLPKLAAFTALILGLAWASIQLPQAAGRDVAFWPANAILLAVLLISPRARWPAWLAAAAIGNLGASWLAGTSAEIAGVLTFFNLFEASLSAVLLNRITDGRLDPSRASHFVRFALVAGVASPLVSASLSAGVIDLVAAGSNPITWATKAAADGLGALIAVPMFLTFRRARSHLRETPLTVASAGALALLAVTSVLVFSVSSPILVLVPAALLLVVFQLELMGAALGVLIVMVIAVTCAQLGLGPLNGVAAGLGGQVLLAQLFLAAITLTSFPTAAALAQRRRLHVELLAAREAAEEAATVKADFMANMSHELRTPLTSVLGFTRLALEQQDLTPTTRSYIGKAANAGAALLATVNDILDFSKLETGQLQVRPEPADPAKVCAETLDIFSESAAAKGVRLRFEGAGLPACVEVDPDRLRQLLLNLVGNAVKFSDSGEIVLTARWDRASQHLVVSVADQGPGIAGDQQALLFRRFSQVDGSATRRHGGTGLGLAICMGLVEAMGGRIGVESEIGEGARFYFDIPAPEAVLAVDDDSGEGIDFPIGVRVLVADDHAVNRELVRAVLAPLGAEVTEAANGAEALDQAGVMAFDVILMDLRMPEMDGLAAMTAIRAGGGPNADAPILAFSAGVDTPGAEGRLRAGFDGDLSKPLMPGDLVMAVAVHGSPRAAARYSESHAA